MPSAWPGFTSGRAFPTSAWTTKPSAWCPILTVRATTDYKGIAAIRGQRSGVLAEFTFRRDWIRTFRNRPAFAFLDDALRQADPPIGSWTQRAMTAVRALNVASPMQSQPIRIVLQAVALEALLGDDTPAAPNDFRSQAHPVAQRAAFLTCPVDGQALPARGSACVDLTAKSARGVERDPRLGNRPPNYWVWPCSAYWEVREVFAARNEALHGARDHFADRTAMRFEGRVDDIILATLDWVVATGATGLADLDAAIARLARA
jgi:hypothetical protein